MTPLRDFLTCSALAWVLCAACGNEFTSADSSGEDSGTPGSGGRGAPDGAVPSGGSGGTSSGGTVGRGGMTSAGGAGGVSSTGGVSSSGGAQSTGGVSSSGGVPSTGGVVGSGGITTLCAPGELDCDENRMCGESGQWHDHVCGPLVISDVTGLNPQGFPSFDVGFRCKALSVCGIAQNCLSYAEHLGTLQSSEPLYYDGLTLTAPAAVKIRIGVGAASQCMNPPITIAAGEKLVVSYDGDLIIEVYFPAFTGLELTLYVREDGATFYDAGLTQLAQGAR